jgi:NAD(P) transhydrogenase subunit beta
MNTAAFNVPANPIDVAYLVTSILFILGLKFLSSPATARKGNQFAGVGMVIAVIATLCNKDIYGPVVGGSALGSIHCPYLILIGVVVGGSIGFFSARSVKMTAMPQMVALFNGAGGGAAALVATADFLQKNSVGHVSIEDGITILLTTIIGSLSIAGSVIAFLKLQELMTGRPITYPGQKIVNGLVLLIIVVSAIAAILW